MNQSIICENKRTVMQIWQPLQKIKLPAVAIELIDIDTCI